MAETNDSSDVPQKGTNAPLRLRMGEVGQTGLVVIGGQVGLDAEKWELQWPYCVNTYTKMRNNSTIAPALHLVEMMMSRVKWNVKVPRGASKALKDKQKYLKQVMNDMDHSWFSFIREATSFNTYGFAIHEIVLRQRRKRYGSKYDDGLVGIEKLATRAQETIYKWNYDEYNRDLLSIEQKVYKNVESSSYNSSSLAVPYKTIPRYKFLLFRNATRKDSPLGISPLSAAWEDWKYMTAIQEFEAIGIATDSRGLKVLYIPPHYMAEDASDEEKEVYTYYKQIMNNLHKTEQSGIILPQVIGEDGKSKQFELELLGVQGQRTVDPNIVIERYAKSILTCLFADSLQLGQKSVGSYSLADSKSSTVAMYMESKLLEIKDQLNHHLVRLLWEANGWDLDEVPEIYFEDLDERDVDLFSKFVQRVGAVGYLPKTVEVVNQVLAQMNLDPYPEDTDLKDFNLPEDVSKSGEGMKTGSSNGTGKSVSKDDNSTSNAST